jgi:hypothetical protein
MTFWTALSTCFQDVTALITGPDPSTMVLIGAYLTVAVFAVYVALTKAGQYDRYFWVPVIILCGLLAVFRGLGIHGLFRDTMACAAQTQEWHEDIVAIQMIVVVTLMFVTLSALVLFPIGGGRGLERTWIAGVGVVLLVLYGIVRLAGYSPMPEDSVLWGPAKMTALPELFCLGLILLNALLRLKKRVWRFS